MKITDVEVGGYERVARAEDEGSGLLAYVSVHSTVLGPSLGGMRLWPYATESEALTDVLRLSRGMTFKSAVAQTGLGGGKSVVVADPHDKSPELFEAMGRFVDTFGGGYITAQDVNVGVSDLRHVRRATRYVAGLTREEGGGGDPGPYTAYGCYLAVGAALAEATGSGEIAGRTVAVQGLGSVGFALAQRLAAAGAELVVSDLDERNLTRASELLGATPVAANAIYAIACDVFAPCALGGVLNDETIPRLKCAVVAGSANNQLLDEQRHAAALQARGILYAPDYVANAGGIMNIAAERQPGGYDEEAALARIRTIPSILHDVFTRARERGMTTHEAARELAEVTLSGSRVAG
jgi:leucine dehydrogenase